MNLLRSSEIKGKIFYNEPLCNHTTFRIGGPCKIWVEPQDIDDLTALLEISKTENLPIFLIGEGSNLLISDKALNIMAISLKDSCGAGRGLQKFILEMIESGYTGLEFMAGIPGTIGGAIRMNAGAGLNGPWISDFIDRVKVADFNGDIRYIEKKDLRFGYRQSNLEDFIILEAGFNLKTTKDKDASLKEYKKFLTEKKNKQELSMPSAGCVFKNSKDSKLTAAEMIDKCGLKSKKVGDAKVSNKHANFIVNLGKATFRDVMKLIDLVKEEVLKKYNIVLEKEIEILE